MVGDPAQTIHSFAGAQAHFLTGFARRFPDATVVKLVRDYRSTPQVVGCANAVMAAGSGAVTLQAQQPAGPEVEFAEAPDEPAEAAGIADWLSAQAAAGVAYRRDGRAVPDQRAVAGDRAGAGRPRHSVPGPWWRAVLRAARGPPGVADATHRGPGPEGFEQGSSGTALEQFKALLGALGWSPQPPEGAGAVRERWESLAALFSVAEDLQADADDPADPLTLQSISAELDRRAEAQHVPAAQGVTVSTLHSAKGLEWDAVALLGVHEGSLPFVLATSPDQQNEERRLLYVGITRARRLLRISWSRTRNGGGNARKPSRFLDGVLPDALRSGSATQPRRQPGSGRRAVGALPVLREAAVGGGRTQDGPPSRMPVDLRRGDHGEAPRVAAPGGRRAEAAGVLRLHRRHADRAGRGPAADAGGVDQGPGSGPAKAGKYGDYVLAIMAGRRRAGGFVNSHPRGKIRT